MSTMTFSICNFLVIFVANVHGAIVKIPACSESTQLIPEQVQAPLDAHNLHRSQASNRDAANMVKWNGMIYWHPVHKMLLSRAQRNGFWGTEMKKHL